MTRSVDIFEPHTWPKFWRRLFLLTFPISVPFYVLLLIATVISVGVIIFLMSPVVWAYELWTGKDF